LRMFFDLSSRIWSEMPMSMADVGCPLDTPDAARLKPQ
jgi:hypothetical protein